MAQSLHFVSTPRSLLSLLLLSSVATGFSPIRIAAISASPLSSVAQHALFPNKRGIVVQAEGEFVAKDPLLDDFLGRSSTATVETSSVRNESNRSSRAADSHVHAAAISIGPLADPQLMKVRDIQAELQQRYVAFQDCFDRNSLVLRLMEARAADTKIENMSNNNISNASTKSEGPSHRYPVPPTSSQPEFDKISTLDTLRALSRRELQEKLVQYSSSTTSGKSLLDKEDIVQAVCLAMEKQHHPPQRHPSHHEKKTFHYENNNNHYSLTGRLIPGQAAWVRNRQDEELLRQELGWDNEPTAAETNNLLPPLLIYVTDDQGREESAHHFQQAANDLGQTMRVMWVDGNQCPSILKLLGVRWDRLPTLMYLERENINGVMKEVDRREGTGDDVWKKGDIVEFVNMVGMVHGGDRQRPI